MTTATIYTNNDAYIDGKYFPNDNYNSTHLAIAGTDYYWRSLLEFNLSSIPSDATINSVTFYIYVWQLFGGSASYTINRNTAQFSESTLTWNNQPAHTITNNSTIIVDATGWKSANVTAMFVDAFTNSWFGIKIMNSDPGWYADSKERDSGINSPYIVVDYTPASYNDIYVKLTGSDANNGTSWTNAKQTINAGINVLNVGGTLHVAFGDYSTQTAINLDKTMDILCENDGGGGTGTVVLPVTA